MPCYIALAIIDMADSILVLICRIAYREWIKQMINIIYCYQSII